MTRASIFAQHPMIAGFLSTLLEDLQHNENESACLEDRETRDVGTIYECPVETFRAAKRFCEEFTANVIAAEPGILSAQMWNRELFEAIGSDLYLEMSGHGAGFADRSHYDSDKAENARIAGVLSFAVPGSRHLETYLGDDGQAWICGHERERVVFVVLSSKPMPGLGKPRVPSAAGYVAGIWHAITPWRVDKAALREALPFRYRKAFDRDNTIFYHSMPGRSNFDESGRYVGDAPTVTLRDRRGRYLNTITLLPVLESGHG